MLKPSADTYRGLRAQVDDCFPCPCGTCGRTYETFESFFFLTNAPGSSGLRESSGVGRPLVVEIMRVCQCGTPIVQPCDDRRHRHRAIQRAQFDHLREVLSQQGFDDATAKAELRKVMRGEESEFLSELT